MTWGVWCVRAGGQMPPAETWLKENGVEWTAATEEEAVDKARETTLAARETFTAAGRPCPLTYTARSSAELARREIFKNLKERRAD